MFRSVRKIAHTGRGLYTTFGIFLVAGTIVAIGATWTFATIAEQVREGATQVFDNAVLTWIGAHRSATITAVMVELTSLGTGVVVMSTVIVAALFLWLSRHRHSAVLLVFASVGGIILNGLLKLGFSRPRPKVIAWDTHAVSSSFPSGHAMNAIIVYGTVAYLAARLLKTRTLRVITFSIAGLIIAAVCASRVYLGVHYPSDVLAGLVVGLGWAAFCMATLEAAQLYARRNAPEALRDEKPAPAPGPLAPEAPGPTQG